MTVLADQTKLPNGQAVPSMAQMMEMFEALKADNEALRAKLAQASTRKIGFRVNDWKKGDLDSKGERRTEDGKRGVTITGIGINGMTAYASQWQKIAEVMPDLLAFIEENKARLAWK